VNALDWNQLSYTGVYTFTTLGFLSIYVGIGALTQFLTTRYFPEHGRGHVISERQLPPGQRAAEVRSSLLSIVLFGGYGVLTLFGLHAGFWGVSSARPGAVLAELVFLVLWNDVHFYVIHRLLHLPLLYRWVHRHHHRAIRPTPWSTFAMHPLEAILLGSVMVLVMPFHDFSWLTLLLFPVVSLALNNVGHMNYDVAPGVSDWHPLAGSRRHEQHHHFVHGNYGFMLPLLDRLFKTELPR
jgi:Delta7-sterol 5-desaturase